LRSVVRVLRLAVLVAVVPVMFLAVMSVPVMTVLGSAAASSSPEPW
jgi:hypothetical protein